MKKIICSLLLSLPLGVGAQTLYDVTPFMDNDLTGTSRFISMGGSMGALGGDISVMGTNPAGIALYRRSDFSFTGSLNFNNTKAKYNKTSVSSDYASGDVESMCRTRQQDECRWFGEVSECGYGLSPQERSFKRVRDGRSR